jgi:DNA invertase Pin-like site-specific DNA recombinase
MDVGLRALQARGMGFRVPTGPGVRIDARTAGGRPIFGIFAALAEFERDLVRERVQAGSAAARAKAARLSGAGARPVQVDRATRTPRPAAHKHDILGGRAGCAGGFA